MENYVTFTGATDALFSKAKPHCRQQRETQMESYSRFTTKRKSGSVAVERTNNKRWKIMKKQQEVLRHRKELCTQLALLGAYL